MEQDVHSPLTNGNLENSDKDKTQREREWEKHKPPWVEELKSNLKSTKSPPGENKLEKKTPSSGECCTVNILVFERIFSARRKTTKDACFYSILRKVSGN